MEVTWTPHVPAGLRRPLAGSMARATPSVMRLHRGFDRPARKQPAGEMPQRADLNRTALCRAISELNSQRPEAAADRGQVRGPAQKIIRLGRFILRNGNA